MFGKAKKCIVCQKEILKGSEIKKYQSYFCGSGCVDNYEKLLEEARKKVKIDKCC